MPEIKSKYSTHVLELVRNNGISFGKKEETTGFLMFDYFDICIYKELVEGSKNYLDYFSIKDTFKDEKDYKVSYKTLSLYCHASEETTNPFLIRDDKRLTETPFLGLIQISLCNENFKDKTDKEIDIEKFLKECEINILAIVNSIDAHHDGAHLVKQLYRSSTTGDFCLVVRTDSVERIYNIALALNDSQSDSDNKVKMMTYTNVGIECRVLPDGSYGTLNEQFVKKHHNMTFALRLSADVQLMKILEEYQKAKQNVKLESVKGLFGRYDYLLHINMEEFAEIFPVLCEKKFGVRRKGTPAYKKNKIELGNILRYPHIRNINERVLVELDALQEKEGNDPKTETGYLQNILTKNNELFQRIENIEKWQVYFSEEERAFGDLFRGMKEIYKAFSAIGMEREAYINWLMFYQDIEILCECIECYMQFYKDQESQWDEEKRRSYRLRVLKDWRFSIQAVNQYTRLVQNINYQTYQSPIYEIQTQIDTEKTIVAYREAMWSFIDSYLVRNASGTDDRASIIPIIYPDLSKDKVEVTASFHGEAGSKKRIRREIVCTVPSFEYFGRLYDLLPWIFHESAHHLRILDKKERNSFFVEYVFSYVFQAIMMNALPKLSNDKLYVSLGRMEQHLINSMVEIAKKEFCKLPNFEEFGFEKMISEMDNYFESLFPVDKNRVGSQTVYGQQEIRDELFQFYLTEYRKEDLLDSDSLKCLKALKEGKAVFEYGELAHKLLEIYFNRICRSFPVALEAGDSIQLEDLSIPREWFEEKLVKTGERLLEASIPEDAVKDYCYKVARVYRIANVYNTIEQRDTESEGAVGNYINMVYDDYHEWFNDNSRELGSVLLSDPGVMYILRNLGLLNDDKKTFCSKMLEIFRSVDCNEVKKYKEDRTTVYREAFADLLMTTSLNIDSFGYCRQVLQTISDTQVEERKYRHDDNNDKRFRIVIAVLLEEELETLSGEGKKELIRKEVGHIRLDGSSLIEKGIDYCEYTLKCICQKLKDDKEISESEKNKELVEIFTGNIFSQLEVYLRDLGKDGSYRSTLLYVLLHGESMADAEILKEWHKYDAITDKCIPIKYIFWRLEYFCLGLEQITYRGDIVVPLDIFEHMKKIRRLIKKQNGKGCTWEDDWKCLSGPKLDVGEFFNDPKLVFEKKTQQKLENTIDFIQNYYYFNRFKMMEKEDVI